MRIRASRYERTVEACGQLVAQFLILLPLGSWALMLLLGILNREASQAVPALDFWTCVALVFLAAFVKAAVAPNFPEDRS